MRQKPAFGPEKYAAGDTIIQQGDEADRFYIITSGEVDVIMQHPDGAIEVKERLRAGAYFGELGLLTRQRRNATVRAVQDVNLMSMDRQTFARWVNSSKIIQEELKELVQQRLPNIKTQPVSSESANKLPTLEAGFFDVEQLDHMEMFPPGRTIVEQGEVADKFYIIVDGEVDVVVPYGEQDEVHVDRLKKGDYFGEVGLLEKGTRIATVRARTAVKLITFSRNSFVAWMKSNPDSQDEIELTSSQRLMDTGRASWPPPELLDQDAAGEENDGS